MCVRISKHMNSGGEVVPVLKAKIAEGNGVRRTLMRIYRETGENNRGITDIILVGIKRRGVCL